MRIFLKIFLSFWFTMILVGAAVAWVGFQARGEVEAKVRERVEQLIEAREALREVLLNQGEVAARRALEESPERDHLFVLERGGDEMLGRELPPDLLSRREYVNRLPPRGERPPGPPPFAGPFGFGRGIVHGAEPGSGGLHRLLRSRPVRLDDGRVFFLMALPDRPRILGRLLLTSPWPLAAAFAVSGLMVFLLARHFAAPVRRLREAAGRFAEGELDARVGPVRRWVPDELSELAAGFDRMAGRTEGLVRSHKRLLRDVSHELRSPLARLRVALGLVEQKSPRSAPELARMEREVERLDELIGQVLTLARLDGGEPPARESLIDLEGLVIQVAEDAAFESSDGGPAVRVENTCAAPLMADAALLHSALDNVVRNALRHSPEGEAVSVSMVCRDGWADVSVRDRGSGVPEGDLERIFEPFVRIGEARDRESGGHGVGLAIAARAVRAHGGVISAANHPEGGLMITLRLPVDSANTAD